MDKFRKKKNRTLKKEKKGKYSCRYTFVMYICMRYASVKLKQLQEKYRGKVELKKKKL